MVTDIAPIPSAIFIGVLVINIVSVEMKTLWIITMTVDVIKLETMAINNNHTSIHR
ncbi:hypothetical protein D3C85_16090 [compost metagenome]